jgi:hypothetical protein
MRNLAEYLTVMLLCCLPPSCVFLMLLSLVLLPHVCAASGAAPFLLPFCRADPLRMPLPSLYDYDTSPSPAQP